ncbi:MAG: hypothetical protein E7369_05215, partial [Clostridiales bacterium]|nr:hypothetical protein [Clostridiales bacterium]
MKNKKLFIVVLSLIMTICACGLVACGETPQPLTLSNATLQMEAYDDVTISVTDDVKGEVTWSSSDTSIVTVTNGVLSAQGKVGSVEITATADGREGKCSVKVINSMLRPRIVESEQVGAVGGLTDVTLEIRYNGRFYTNYTVQQITVADTTIAVGENGKIKGLKEGETTATIKVSWKGVTVTGNDIPVKIVAEKVLTTDLDEYDVYSVNSTSKVKKSVVEIQTEVRYRGQKDDSAVTYEIVSGADYITLENNKITAKHVTEVQQATVKISNAKYELEKEVTVNVYPNFIQKANTDLKPFGNKAVYAPAGSTVGGRDSAYKFYLGEDCLGAEPDWTKFGNQLEITDTKTISNASQYNYLVKELGVRLIAVDLYYAGQEVAGVREYRGVTINMLYGPSTKDELYYVDHQKNVSERFIVDDGVITNTLKANTWVTVYFDLSKVEEGTKIDSFINSSRVRDEIYVDNLRYYYDDASVCGLQSTVDMDERELTADTTNPAKFKADSNEFMVFAPSFTDFAVP